MTGKENDERAKKSLNKLRRECLDILGEKFDIDVDQMVDDAIPESTKFVVNSIFSGKPMSITPSSFLLESDVQVLLLNIATMTRLCMIFDMLIETFEDDPEKAQAVVDSKSKVQTALTVCVDLCTGYAVKEGYAVLPREIEEAIEEKRSIKNG